MRAGVAPARTVPATVSTVPRFGGSERLMHLVHATGFTLLAATGCGLGLPCLAKAYGAEHRPLVLAAHLVIATAWMALVVLLFVFGDARRLRRTAQEFESLDARDLRWLRSKAARREPQGRFNGGQKLHGIVQGAATLLLLASGALLWIGLSRPTVPPPGTLGVHDFTMALAVLFIVGHVGMALSPSIRPSLRGIVRGDVPASYAAAHHAAWDPHAEKPDRLPRRSLDRLATGAFLLAIGVAVVALIVEP